MKVYPDTSVLLAWFYPRDYFAPAVRRWCVQREAEFSWNLVLRLELRHSLRRLSGSYARVAWEAYRASEASKCLIMDLRPLKHFFEWADELSATLPAGSTVGTWDCVHIAAALHSGAEMFLTCDAAQAEAARVLNCRNVHLFK